MAIDTGKDVPTKAEIERATDYGEIESERKAIQRRTLRGRLKGRARTFTGKIQRGIATAKEKRELHAQRKYEKQLGQISKLETQIATRERRQATAERLKALKQRSRPQYKFATYGKRGISILGREAEKLLKKPRRTRQTRKRKKKKAKRGNSMFEYAGI